MNCPADDRCAGDTNMVMCACACERMNSLGERARVKTMTDSVSGNANENGGRDFLRRVYQ